MRSGSWRTCSETPYTCEYLSPGVSGADPGGIIVTTLIGIAGAFIGGLITKALGFGDPIDEFFDFSTWLGAIIGSIVLLLIYRMVVGRGRSRTAY